MVMRAEPAPNGCMRDQLRGSDAYNPTPQRPFTAHPRHGSSSLPMIGPRSSASTSYVLGSAAAAAAAPAGAPRGPLPRGGTTGGSYRGSNQPEPSARRTTRTGPGTATPLTSPTHMGAVLCEAIVEVAATIPTMSASLLYLLIRQV